ncbi:TetR/AcrR family transcriptional regulator [Alkaliphilus sp. B6464]|uniref:TetR/AcrR family transcriptional regulator n=1 Tax=Alkaliphilus sp. B6464 TaxID=2731219 RepID=UPI001BAD9837|nr:TetR/AcrR family transcriptional regulator [Alkaliphilus sp. B6464]QUH21286.1 TetR family transcriptional regulator [Alkaliphilus sp. B6464]
MAQYKKDKIKEDIDTAALIVFSEKGYKGTKISDIAKKANISVGNIYRYYKSKDEIFISIVPESFLISVKDLLLNKIFVFKEKKLQYIGESDEFLLINDEFIKFIVENRERILIVFHNNKGTKYEYIKLELINFLIKAVLNNYTIKYGQLLNKNKIEFVIKTIYENLINMTLNILQEAKTIEEVKGYLEVINSYHMFGVANLFE